MSRSDQIRRTVKSLYMKYIRKHHHFILCKYERDLAEKLDDFLCRSRIIYFSRPHNNDKFWCQGTIRPTETALDVIKALINFLVSVHLAGYTFDGKLTIGDLYWLPGTKSIKIWGLSLGDLVEKNKTKSGERNDFSALEGLISSNVFSKCKGKVPRELRHLLDLMKTDPLSHQNLIIHNIILLDDESKVARYIILHQKLVQAKMVDDAIYRKAMSYVKCGDCGQFRCWQNAVLFHPMLLQVLNYKKNKLLPGDAEGVSVYGRHCCHHILKYAAQVEDNKKQNLTAANTKLSDSAKSVTILIDQGGANCQEGAPANVHTGNTKSVTLLGDQDDESSKEGPMIKFSVADIFPLIDCFIPGLFSQVQEAVFKIIEHDYPDKLQKLRSTTTGGA